MGREISEVLVLGVAGENGETILAKTVGLGVALCEAGSPGANENVRHPAAARQMRLGERERPHPRAPQATRGPGANAPAPATREAFALGPGSRFVRAGMWLTRRIPCPRQNSSPTSRISKHWTSASGA